MDYDKDKVDEYTLALMYLVIHQRLEGSGARAWKGFDWDTMNRLHEKGYISNPIGKAKSVLMDEGGYLKAQELFRKFFGDEATTVVFLPKLTAGARKRWNQIPESAKKGILESVWCSQCRTGASMQLQEGKIDRRLLVLNGICKKCGGEVTRVVEFEE